MINFLYQTANVISGLLRIRSGLSFPAPNGPYNTSLATAKLVDYHRHDPFASVQQPRALMVSIFAPVLSSACSSSHSPYMDQVTASFEDQRLKAYGLPSGIFESITLETCQHESLGLPVILFSPAAGTTRLFYSAMAQQIASTGYVVVTIDHPYDADIVVFPDNTTVFGLDFTDEQIPLAVDTRAKDITFVLNQFAFPTTFRNSNIKCKLDVSNVGVFGHSLGGAASAEAMLFDSRLVGGVNLDGTFFGDVVEKGLDRPFLLFAHDGKNLTNDPSWEAFWSRLTGWKRELMLTDSAHYTFSDLPDVVDLLGFTGILPSEVEDIIGSINGRRAFEIVTIYVQSFFDRVLKGRESRLLEGPDARYPEVTFGGF
ncbi:hypothetical protein EG329_008936 [Mollisiaceae sp. DMI_Dod_QoI]|nr:hypothetical protein EG329_008936 [Helotiales sp. DMI_Dod_QoI]